MTHQERLDISIDGVTYNVARRKFKTGTMGFLLNAGSVIHGRPSWIQVLIVDRAELTPEARVRKTALNRARKKFRKERGLRVR